MALVAVRPWLALRRESRQEAEARAAREWTGCEPWDERQEAMTEPKAVTVREPSEAALRPEATFTDLMLLANELVRTGFLPREVNTAAKAVAIILTGRELGIGPMQSLRSVSIINGKPVLAADLQLGLFHRSGGKSRFVELTPERAKLELSAPWLSAPHVETFSMEDAKRANLTRNQVWTQYPKAMLRSRVITAALKSAGFEPCAGMYDPEEMGGTPVIKGQIIETEAAPTSPETAEPPPSVDDTLPIRMRLTMALKAPCFRKDRWQGQLRTDLKLDEETTVNEWLKSPRRSMQELMQAEEIVSWIANEAAGEKEAGVTKAPLGAA